MTKEKQQLINEYKEKHVYPSWTYAKLTGEEKQALEALFDCTVTENVLKGTHDQKMRILIAIHYSFLCGLGYGKNPVSWRDGGAR